MTPEEAIEYVRETQRIADENHLRALALYDLVFPPWRWLKWWREYRAIRAAMHEVEVRNVISNGWLADGPTRERSDDVSDYPEGATVQFKGGLGRGNHADPATIYTGIVNGPTQFKDGGAWVPIHVREQNHNLIVASTNIVKVIQP